MKTLVGTSLFLSIGVCSAIADPPFDTNLIQNPSAESGPSSGSGGVPVPVPGWNVINNATVASYGAQGVAGTQSPGSPNRGNQFFIGGPDGQTLSSLSQTIDISPIAEAIDLGRVGFRMAAYLGGVAGQDDSALLAAVFNDTNGDSVGTGNLIGPTNFGRNNITGMLLRQRTGTIPPGTRTVTLVLSFSRAATTTNDGCADDLSLVLSLNPCPSDVNTDGGVDGDDVIVFFSEWDANNADFNQDGGTDGDDVIAFFARWDEGC
jgi:hypothetical protein